MNILLKFTFLLIFFIYIKKFNFNSFIIIEINDALRDEFLNKKKNLCSSVYKLLKNICLNNPNNKTKTAKYLPIFSMQSFYIPNALDCIISIIENFEHILMNIRNEFDEAQEDISNLQPGTSSPESRRLNNSPKKGSSPSKILRESKFLNDDINIFKSDTDIDFINENMKKNRTYVELYDTLVASWHEQDELIIKKTQWNLLNFFIMMIFQADLTLNDKKNLLRFLKTTVVFEETGVNVNQELIFKYFLLGSKKINELIFKKLLFDIKTSGSTIIITNEENQTKLEEIFAGNSFGGTIPEKKANKLLQLIPQSSSPLSITKQKKMKNALTSYNPSKYVCDQIDFYSMMCNGRNHTWKKFLEENIKFQAMIQYLDLELEFGKFNDI